MTVAKPNVSNRDLRRTAANHAQVLEQFGACLDGQAEAIKGLAENQRVLHDAVTSLGHRVRQIDASSFWQRLRWLLRGA